MVIKLSFFDVVNIYGLAFAALLVLPHVLYHRSHTVDKTLFTNHSMVYIDRIGRYGSVFLMAFNVGVLEGGFTEPKELMERFWLISTAVLTLLYLLLWYWFLKTERRLFANLIIAVSSIIIIFSGILQVKTLLLTAGIVYLIGELYMASRLFQK